MIKIVENSDRHVFQEECNCYIREGWKIINTEILNDPDREIIYCAILEQDEESSSKEDT